MIPITPRGIRILPTWRPLGLCHIRSTPPIGSCRAATSRRASAISLIRFWSSMSLSSMAEESPFSAPAARSFPFSATSSSVESTRAAAIAWRREFLAPDESFAMAIEAWRALVAISRTVSAIDMMFSLAKDCNCIYPDFNKKCNPYKFIVPSLNYMVFYIFNKADYGGRHERGVLCRADSQDCSRDLGARVAASGTFSFSKLALVYRLCGTEPVSVRIYPVLSDVQSSRQVGRAEVPKVLFGKIGHAIDGPL